MVKHHVLIGLGFKKNNFRNRALRFMMDKTTKGRGIQTMRPAVMPRESVLIPSMALQKLSRKPLNFNY
jgi:hypothetical protein